MSAQFDSPSHALVSRCQALRTSRLEGAGPLVPIESLPRVVSDMQHFHRMYIGSWVCQLKLTSLCIVLDVRPKGGGPAALAMVGGSTRILRVGDFQPYLAVVKGTREPRIRFGDDVAAAAEIAYQYGLQVGEQDSQTQGSFYDSPAFDTIVLALEATQKPINPLFCRPYPELGDWYAVVQQRLADRQSNAPPAMPLKSIEPSHDASPPGDHPLVISPQQSKSDAVEVSNAALLAWGRRHGINGMPVNKMRDAVLDGATLVILEQLSNSEVGALGGCQVESSLVAGLVKFAQDAQPHGRQDRASRSAEKAVGQQRLAPSAIKNTSQTPSVQFDASILS